MQTDVQEMAEALREADEYLAGPAEKRPSRRQRRVMEAVKRRQRTAAQAHQCVLNRDCLKAGVAVELDPREYHHLHAARGERSCAACPTCQAVALGGPVPRELTSEMRATVRESWERRLRHHQEMVSIAALCMHYAR